MRKDCDVVAAGHEPTEAEDAALAGQNRARVTIAHDLHGCTGLRRAMRIANSTADGSAPCCTDLGQRHATGRPRRAHRLGARRQVEIVLAGVLHDQRVGPVLQRDLIATGRVRPRQRPGFGDQHQRRGKRCVIESTDEPFTAQFSQCGQ